MEKLPVKLNKDTIVEATFEIRFAGNIEAIANILLGLLVQEFRTQFPKVERLGLSDIPQKFIQSDPNLRYGHYYKLVGDKYSLNIGEHVLSLNCQRPYTGWPNFKPKIIEILGYLKSTALINQFERFSLKYMNIVPSENTNSIESFQVAISAGDFDLYQRPLKLRTEIQKNDYINIVQISTGVAVKVRNVEELNGVLLDIDTIHQGGYKDFWKEIPDLLEDAHAVEKQVFFGLLKPETIDKLEPEY